MFGNLAGQFAVFAEEPAANGIGCIHRNSSDLERLGIDDAGMAASMTDIHRMIANHVIDVVAIKWPLVFELRVVIHDTANPVTRWRLCGLASKRLFDLIDTPQIDVDADGFLGE